MKTFVKACVVISILSVVSVAAFAQGPQGAAAEEPKAAPAAPATAPAPAAQAKEIAIYGEVQAVDTAAGTISVQYYDYDSDSEKTAVIGVVKETVMENAKVVGDVKKGDWVDVTYTVADGKNTAKMVSVEKEEPTTEPPAGTTATEPME